MIIFDLDGTLADCEHRRHFVDRNKNLIIDQNDNNVTERPNWKPNWKSFYETCDKDDYIVPTLETFRFLRRNYEVEIWSGRCESVRHKTFDWLFKYEPYLGWVDKIPLRMRPIGDSTPDDQLKEKWLDEAIASGKTIDFVFDDRPKTIRVWRRRGIFVFNCCQHDEEF